MVAKASQARKTFGTIWLVCAFVALLLSAQTLSSAMIWNRAHQTSSTGFIMGTGLIKVLMAKLTWRRASGVWKFFPKGPIFNTFLILFLRIEQAVPWYFELLISSKCVSESCYFLRKIVLVQSFNYLTIVVLGWWQSPILRTKVQMPLTLYRRTLKLEDAFYFISFQHLMNEPIHHKRNLLHWESLRSATQYLKSGWIVGKGTVTKEQMNCKISKALNNEINLRLDSHYSFDQVDNYFCNIHDTKTQKKPKETSNISNETGTVIKVFFRLECDHGLWHLDI